MLEKVLQKQIIDYCKSKRIYCLNIYGSGYSSKGVPDLILCIKGRFVALELKVGKNTLQDDQIIHGRRIMANGGIWATPRTLEEAVKIIESVRGE